MLPSGMNNLTILFNFQTERALKETLQTNVHLLSATNGKLFQKAFSEIQEKVIRVCRLSGELDIVVCLLNF